MNARIKALVHHREVANGRSFPDRGSLIVHAGSEGVGERRILHIVPHIYFERGYEFLGSSKDIDGRQQYLWQCGAAFDTFRHLKDHLTLADDLSFFDLPEYSHIIIDLARSPEDIAYVRNRWPGAQLIIRSHNLELPHRIDYLRASVRMGASLQEKKPVLTNIAIFLRRERGIARHADIILHIETLNTTWYWRSLKFRGRIYVAPYFISDFYLQRIPRGRPRNKSVLCVGSSHPGALIEEMLINFHSAVDGLGDRLPDWAFCATGDMPRAAPGARITERVTHLGLVKDLFSLLTETFAIAVTSDLGRGFKTKILEAIVCGCWVIVTPALMRRMPDVLKPYCAVYRLGDPEGLACALEELCGRQWPEGDPNATLREEAFRSLDLAIFGDSAKEPRAEFAVSKARMSPGSAL